MDERLHPSSRLQQQSSKDAWLNMLLLIVAQHVSGINSYDLSACCGCVSPEIQNPVISE